MLHFLNLLSWQTKKDRNINVPKNEIEFSFEAQLGSIVIRINKNNIQIECFESGHNLLLERPRTLTSFSLPLLTES